MQSASEKMKNWRIFGKIDWVAWTIALASGVSRHERVWLLVSPSGHGPATQVARPARRLSSLFPPHAMSSDSPEPAAPTAGGAPSPDAGPSANAVRVARHKRKLAAMGLRQLNVQVPVETHDLLKALAQRLRDGEDPSAALFDLVAEQSAPAEPSAMERRIDPRPPLDRSELKNRMGAETPEDRMRADAQLGARVREILSRGGWRAGLLRNLLG